MLKTGHEQKVFFGGLASLPLSIIVVLTIFISSSNIQASWIEKVLWNKPSTLTNKCFNKSLGILLFVNIYWKRNLDKKQQHKKAYKKATTKKRKRKKNNKKQQKYINKNIKRPIKKATKKRKKTIKKTKKLYIYETKAIVNFLFIVTRLPIFFSHHWLNLCDWGHHWLNLCDSRLPLFIGLLNFFQSTGLICVTGVITGLICVTQGCHCL